MPGHLCVGAPSTVDRLISITTATGSSVLPSANPPCLGGSASAALRRYCPSLPTRLVLESRERPEGRSGESGRQDRDGVVPSLQRGRDNRAEWCTRASPSFASHVLA